MARLTPHTLRSCLRGILSDRPRRGQIQEYVELAHGLARATIKTSRFHRKTDLGIHSRSDLAMDAIADLFERDGRGRFVHLIRYFESREWDSLSDRELWTINRKLISGAVADSYFRNYRLADPSLARIIRNTKRGVQQSDDLTLSRISGQLHVSVTDDASLDGMTWDVASLTARLVPAARESAKTPDLLDHVADLLRRVEYRKTAIRLSVLALAIRECSVILNTDEDAQGAEALLTKEEIDRAINEALISAYDSKRSFYIEKGKLTEREFLLLRKAIELRLKNEVGVSVPGESNYEAVRTCFPELSNEQYRERYRNAFEYLFRLTHSAFCTIINDWIGESAA